MREPTQRPALRSLPPWFGAVAFLCASAFYVTAILLSPPLVGLYHDDGIYIGSALSLARGDGYRIPHLPGSPLQAKYPPLYPLVLLPIAWIVGNSPTAIGLYRWPSVLATLGALALLPGLFRRWGLSERAAFGAAVLCGLSPLLFQHALFALSEPVFLLLTIATFRLLPLEATSPTREIPSALCAAAAVLCRSIGIALIPALALRAWSLRRQPGAWIPLAASAMAAALWSAASAWMRAIEESRRLGSLYDYYLGYGRFVPGRLSDLATIVSTNAYELWLSLGDLFLGWRWVKLGTGLWTIPALIVGAFAVLAWRELLRRDAAAGVYVITSVALISIWPYPSVRYLIPLTPFIVASAFMAAEQRLRTWPNSHWVSYALALIAIVSCLTVDVTRFPSSFKLQIGAVEIDPGPFDRAAAWLKAHSEPDDIVISDHDPWVFLATGRRALPPGHHNPLWEYGQPVESAAWNGAWEETRRYKARWLILTYLWEPRFRELWMPHIVTDRDSFEPRYQGKGINIFALHPPK